VVYGGVWEVCVDRNRPSRAGSGREAIFLSGLGIRLAASNKTIENGMEWISQVTAAMRGSLTVTFALFLAAVAVKWAAWKEWTDIGLAVTGGFFVASIAAILIRKRQAIKRRKLYGRLRIERTEVVRKRQRKSMIEGLRKLGEDEKDVLASILAGGNRTAVLDISDAPVAGLMHRQIITRTSDVSVGGMEWAIAVTDLAMECLDEAGLNRLSNRDGADVDMRR